MSFKVDISVPALEDAESAVLWIKEHYPELANNWYKGLLEAIFSLENSPNRCPIAPESKHFEREIRQLIYGKTGQTYRIFYEIIETEKTVRIYRIHHRSRNWLSKEDHS